MIKTESSIKIIKMDESMENEGENTEQFVFLQRFGTLQPTNITKLLTTKKAIALSLKVPISKVKSII